MAQAITAPGDVVLVPNPSYPIHAFGFLMAGGVIRSVPAEPTPEFFPALERAVDPFDPQADRARRLLSVEPDRLRGLARLLPGPRRLREEARAHPAVGSRLCRGLFRRTTRRPRCCRCPGAIDVTVEFTSMSKTFSMAGWRIGFAVGNERLLAALARVKSYLDYGAFTPIQVAATAALNGPDDCIREMRDDLPQAPRRAGRELRQGRLGRSRAQRLDVRLGADPREVPRPRQPRILEAAGREGRRRGRAGHRLRRARRRLCAHRARRERAAHPPGGAQHPPLLRDGRQDAAQRRAAAARR